MSFGKIKFRAPEFKRKKKETPTEQLYRILARLREQGIIDDPQYSKLARPISKPMTQELLVEALVKVGAINPTQPFDESVKDFMEELGSLDSSDLIGFSEDLRNDKKGLNNMTPIPTKAFPIPANVLFIGLIGAAMFIVIVAPSWDSITKGISKAGSGGGGIGGIFGGLMGGHFLLGLVTDFIMGMLG